MYSDLKRHMGHQLYVEVRPHEGAAVLCCSTCKEDVLSVYVKRHEDDGLAPCPLCAGQVFLDNVEGNRLIACRQCGLTFYDSTLSEEDLIARWNTRSGIGESDDIARMRRYIIKLDNVINLFRAGKGALGEARLQELHRKWDEGRSL